MDTGSVLTLDIEKPVAGGRMLARYDGQVVLVWGAIPGERVSVLITRVGKGVAYGDTIEIDAPSADRREGTRDWRCGGNVFAHVQYTRQLQLKGEIIRDAFGRIARIPMDALPAVVSSPELGYRMRARLHVQEGRLGFYREESHDLCDAGETGQLLADTSAWLHRLQDTLGARGLRGVTAVEIAENAAGSERVCHLEIGERINVAALAQLSLDRALTGLTMERVEGSDQPSRRGPIERLSGLSTVTDMLRVMQAAPDLAIRLRRDVRTFFQGNRFLIEPLAEHVLSLVPDGPVVDLYAGVGLFGLCAAAARGASVTLVEGDPVSAGDLQANAEPFQQVNVHCTSVEEHLRMASPQHDATYIADPPRTGLSKEALQGLLEHAPRRIVYVSCDVATLARDVRGLMDRGYQLEGLTAFNLFPNTAHVETVVLLTQRI